MFDHFPDGTGERDELTKPLRDPRDALFVEQQPVAQPRLAREAGKVLRVRRKDLLLARKQRVRRKHEHFVLLRFGRKRRGACVLFRKPTRFGNGHPDTSFSYSDDDNKIISEFRAAVK